jgi:hypothetical protein
MVSCVPVRACRRLLEIPAENLSPMHYRRASHVGKNASVSSSNPAVSIVAPILIQYSVSEIRKTNTRLQAFCVPSNVVHSLQNVCAAGRQHIFWATCGLLWMRPGMCRYNGSGMWHEVKLSILSHV